MPKKVERSDSNISHIREPSQQSCGKTALKIVGLSLLVLTFAGVGGAAGFGIYHFSLYSIGFYSSVALAGADLVIFTGTIVALCCLSRSRNKAARISAHLSKPDYDSDIEASNSNEKSNSKRSSSSDSEPEPEAPKKSKKHKHHRRPPSSEEQKKKNEAPSSSDSQSVFLLDFEYARKKENEESSSAAEPQEEKQNSLVREILSQKRGSDTLKKLKIPDEIDRLEARVEDPKNPKVDRSKRRSQALLKKWRRQQSEQIKKPDVKATEEPKKPEEPKLPEAGGLKYAKSRKKKGSIELDFGGTTEINGKTENYDEEASAPLEDQREIKTKETTEEKQKSRGGLRHARRKALNDLKDGKNVPGHLDRKLNKFVHNQDQLYAKPENQKEDAEESPMKEKINGHAESTATGPSKGKPRNYRQEFKLLPKRNLAKPENQEKVKKEVKFDSDNEYGTAKLIEIEDAKEQEHNKLYDVISNSERPPIEETKEEEVIPEGKFEEGFQKPQPAGPPRADSLRELPVLGFDIPCVIDSQEEEEERSALAKDNCPKLKLNFPSGYSSDEEKPALPPIRILEEYKVEKEEIENYLKPEKQEEGDPEVPRSMLPSIISKGFKLLSKAAQVPLKAIQVPFKIVGNLLNDVFQLEGGPIQKRTYYHLLAPLVDVLFDFLDKKVDLSDRSLEEKLVILRDILEREKTPLSFLVNGPSTDSTEEELYAALQPLLGLAEKDANTFAARQNFFTHIDKIYQSKIYKTFLECAKNNSHTEAKKRYPLVALVQELGFAIFTIVHLHKLAEECVHDVLKEGKATQGDPFGDFDPEKNNLKEVLEADFKAIANAPRALRGTKAFEIYNKLAGHFNIFFHPLETNNFASELFETEFKDEKGNTKTVKCLRFGTPTTEGWENPEIVSQMNLFSDGCAATGKKVISFQHQNPREKGFGKGNEAHRLNKMFELGSKEEYKKTFFVFGLPMDGEFFNQTGKFETENNIEMFKSEFLVNLTNGESGFYLPKEQLDALKIDYASGIKATLNKVHEHFFKGRKELTQEERRIFQILAYIYLEEYFVLALDGDYYHSQCKDSMDRAMVVLALTNYLHLLRSGKETDPQAIQDFRVLVHFAALMIKGTPMHKGRSELLLSILDHLTKLSKEEKASIKKDSTVIESKSYAFQKMKITKENNQSFEKRPSEAKDLEEHAKLLKIDSNYKYQLFFPNFVEEVISETKETDLVKQTEKDVGRELLLVKSEKMAIPKFKEELLKAFPKLGEKTPPGFAGATFADAIVLIEDQNEDPNAFAKALREVLRTANLEDAHEEIFNIRNRLKAEAFKEKLAALVEETFKEKLLALSKGDSKKMEEALKVKAERILKISNQASLPNVTGCIFKRYDFYDKEDKTNLLIKAKQRDTKHGRCNSCINLVVNNKKLYVECYQIFEILNMQTGDVLGYLKTKTLIDVETENATIEWLAPTTNNPKNFFPVVKEADEKGQVVVEDDNGKISFYFVDSEESGKDEE